MEGMIRTWEKAGAPLSLIGSYVGRKPCLGFERKEDLKSKIVSKYGKELRVCM